MDTLGDEEKEGSHQGPSDGLLQTQTDQGEKTDRRKIDDPT